MKLACPSYLVPGTWLENLEAASPISWLGGMELLFFRYDEDARSILSRELAGISGFASRFDLSLHLPDPLGAADEELVELTRPFVGLYVVHPPKEAGLLALWASLLGAWRARYGEAFCLEYTGREAFGAAERELPGLPLCPDTGRLALDGEDVEAWIEARAGRVAELHLHAARGVKDHYALAGDEPWLPRLARLAEERDWRLDLEVFSRSGAAESADALRSILEASR
jgi:hypothetical protein